MIAKDAKVLLSMYEKGTIRLKKSNSMKKFQLKKILKSPMVNEKPDGTKYFSFDNKKWIKAQDNKPIPKYFEGPKYYKEPSYNQVVIKTVINEEAVQFFISEEGRVSSISKNTWAKMTDEERLHAKLEWFAEGKEFDYQIVE